MQTFDPYREWLSIEPHEQPADYYRLLGLARFENDERRIAEAADQRMTLVRSFQTGRRAAATQKLLNELATARVCLLEARTKAAYDAELAARLSDCRVLESLPPNPPPAPPPIVDQERFAQPRAARIRRHSPGRRLKVAAWSSLVVVALGALGTWRAMWPATVFTGSKRNQNRPPTAQIVVPRAETVKSPRPKLIQPTSSGEIVFAAADAIGQGDIAVEATNGRQSLVHWTSSDCQAMWRFRVEKPGFFEAELTYATTEVGNDMALELQIDGRSKPCSLRFSGGLDQFVSDSFTVAVLQSGEHTLTIRPQTQPADDWLVLRSVRFIPIRTDREP